MEGIHKPCINKYKEIKNYWNYDTSYMFTPLPVLDLENFKCLLLLCKVYNLHQLNSWRFQNLCDILYRVLWGEVEHAGLVCWHHILDVDESISATMLLQYLKCFLNKFTNISMIHLCVINSIPQIHCKDITKFVSLLNKYRLMGHCQIAPCVILLTTEPYSYWYIM